MPKPNLPAQKQQNAKIVHQEVTAEFAGPLPLPSHFAEYDRILPGAAERILKMAETQASHRQYCEKHAIRGSGRRAWCGLFVAAMLAIGCVGGGIFLVFSGNSVSGTTIATVSVASLVGVFVYGSQSRKA